MEERKIQKVGRSTLSVSLPKDWAIRADVKQGDTVYMDRQANHALLIVSEKFLKIEGEARDFLINCDLVAESNILARLIVASYVQGADTIRLFSSTRIDGKQIECVRQITQTLIGISIVEASSNEIFLQCAIDPTKFEIYTLIHRLSVIASTMLDEAMDALLDLDGKLARDVVNRRDEANGIYWLITRLLTLARVSHTLADQIGLIEPIDTSLRLVTKNLERVTDCTEKIAEIALDLHTIRTEVDEKELKKLSVLGQMVKDVFRKAVNSFFARDIITANDARDLRDEIVDEAQARRRIASIPYFRAITIMLSMIAAHSASIAVVTFNIKVSESNYLLYLKESAS